MASKNGKDNTDPQGDSVHEELARPKESLLGSRALTRPQDEKFLLRVHGGYLNEKFASFLRTQSYRPAVSQATRGKIPPLVLGPFNRDDLAHFVDEAWIDPEDTLLRSNDRWRSANTYFPELRGAFGELEDVTATSTASASGMGFDDSRERNVNQELPAPNREQTPTPTHEDDELPSLEVEEFESSESTQMSEPTANKRSGFQDAASDMSKPINTFSRSQASAQIKRQTIKDKGPQPLKTGDEAAQQKGFNVALVGSVVGGVGVLAILIAVLSQKPKAPPTPAPTAKKESLATGDTNTTVSSADWPDDLKPLEPSELFKGDDFLVAKIRPILNAYERGQNRLLPEDEKLLKGFAQEGTASWEARRLAANQLAVLYLSNERTADAQNLLLPISNAGAASDPITLLNLALVNMVAGNASMAKELGDQGLRLSQRGVDWVANSIVGMIDTAASRISEATQSFRSALSLSTNNPFIYGIWIQNLMRSGNKQDPEVPKLIREALWADPDRLIDSPIRAPLAGYIIVQQALEGFRKASERSDSKLTAGQTAFSRWLDARTRHDPVSQALSQVMDTLANEEAAQSQLLYAYSLKEQGRLEEASQVMGRLIPLLELEGNFASSWPWTLAGDLQMARKQVAQALVLYQGALTRNPRDVSAVHGMAMAFRAQGDYAGAQRKLNEAHSLDPTFVPSILRMERLEWQRRSMTQ